MSRPSLDHLAAFCLLCALVLAAFYAGVLYEGSRVARAAVVELQDLQRRHARTVAWLHGERTKAEAELRTEIAGLTELLTTNQGKANEDHRNHINGLRAGTVSVRVPIVPASCQSAGLPAPRNTGTGPAASNAQLDPPAAQELAAIAHDGDQSIRELNHCIAQYNAVKRAFERWRTTLQELHHAQTP